MKIDKADAMICTCIAFCVVMAVWSLCSDTPGIGIRVSVKHERKIAPLPEPTPAAGCRCGEGCPCCEDAEEIKPKGKQ